MTLKKNDSSESRIVKEFQRAMNKFKQMKGRLEFQE